MASLEFALRRIDKDYEITNDTDLISKASHIILPGVGAAKNAMMRLKDRELINEIINLKKPTLGICLGMQIFMDASMEEDTDCLGIISNKCKPFKLDSDSPVPNMVWNKVHCTTDSTLTKNLKDTDSHYFVHRYYVPICNETIAVSKLSTAFSAVIAKDNFFGTKFHPEM